MSRFTVQEQEDLFTPEYAAWCLRRWCETKFRKDPDAIMVERFALKIRTQARQIRYPSMTGVFVRGRHVA